MLYELKTATVYQNTIKFCNIMTIKSENNDLFVKT